MKKILSVVAAMCIAFSLASCDGATEKEQTEESKTENLIESSQSSEAKTEIATESSETSLSSARNLKRALCFSAQ